MEYVLVKYKCTHYRFIKVFYDDTVKNIDNEDCQDCKVGKIPILFFNKRFFIHKGKLIMNKEKKICA